MKEGSFLSQIYKIMDKSELDILLECQKELASLKERIGALEARISTLQEKQAEAPAEADEVDFTGVEIGVDVPVDIEPIAELEPVSAVPEPVDVEQIVEPEPEPVPVEPEPVAAAPDDTANLPWRKDNPGMLVKNIRSGISLLDRAQFIGTLFKEDFALYDNTIAALNTMNSLDEAVAYIKASFPQWNLGSDVVYRFMMAIRKKLG